MSDRDSILWESITYREGEADEHTIRYRHDVPHGWMDFEGFLDSQDIDDDPDPTFTGFIKWDGCANFTVGDVCMFHTCDARDLDVLHAAMRRVYERATEVMPNWIGDDPSAESERLQAERQSGDPARRRRVRRPRPGHSDRSTSATAPRPGSARPVTRARLDTSPAYALGARFAR